MKIIDNVDELDVEIVKFKTFKKELIDYLIPYFKNKSIPLENRWATFEKIGEILPINPWIMHFKDLDDNNLEWYDDFGYEKYKTVYLTEVIEFIDEVVNGSFENINLDKVKEEILESGYSGFKFDW